MVSGRVLVTLIIEPRHDKLPKVPPIMRPLVVGTAAISEAWENLPQNEQLLPEKGPLIADLPSNQCNQDRVLNRLRRCPLLSTYGTALAHV